VKARAVIRKLLIANRGEIACRIIATCKRMGIRTVAVYSDADRDAPHVRQADEAVRIGPPEAAASYLNAAAIIDAAKDTDADAIHPGYGFLSERAILPKLCAENGIAWVGPSIVAIERMGSKIESKRIAESAGVVCVPGYHGAAQDDGALTAAAKKIGYPVLIKASAGGGGRGMRRVDKPEELADALQIARTEAQAGFGDPSLLIEKLIQRPRHLEVQLAGDKHGGLVHLFERECSVQRNFQKVVEEAPAPRLAERTRALLFDAALKLGRTIAYDSLGTVEFILEEGEDQPYFLEMNTRLQVEHPVTEMITGLDLVEMQIRAAAGERLPVTQDKIRAHGAAIEVRLNAEAPAQEYRPHVGTVMGVKFPEGEGLRVDTGIAAGSAITPYYDSMLAKVIAHGPDRTIAAQRLAAALGQLAVFGVGTNQAFLRDIISHAQFLRGALTTRFIAEAFPGGWKAPVAGLAQVVAAAAVWADALDGRDVPAHLGPFLRLGSYRVLGPAGRPGRVTLDVAQGDSSSTVTLSGSAGDCAAEIDGVKRAVCVDRRNDDVTVTIDGVARTYAVAVEAERIGLAADGLATVFRVQPTIDLVAARSADVQGGSRVMASMPGLINAVMVEAGQQVEQGQPVVVLEAMKLMIQLTAPVSGRIKELFCVPGQTVAAGTVLAEIAPAAVDPAKHPV